MKSNILAGMGCFMLLFTLILAAQTLSAQNGAKPSGKEAPASDFQYALNDAGDGIKIIRYKGKGGNVIIPSEIEGFPVTQLGEAFWSQTYAVFDNSGLTSLVIPDSIRDLGIAIRNGNYIFSKETSLTTVVLPNGLKEIPPEFFMGCAALQSVNIPNTVRTIGERAFAYNSSLKTVKLPSNPHLRYFPENAFYNCSFSIATQAALKKARDAADYRSNHPDEFPKWEEEFGKRVMKPFKHYFGADGAFYVPLQEGEQYDGEIFMREVIEED